MFSWFVLIVVVFFFPQNTSELTNRSLMYLCFYFVINTEPGLGGELSKQKKNRDDAEPNMIISFLKIILENGISHI